MSAHCCGRPASECEANPGPRCAGTVVRAMTGGLDAEAELSVFDEVVAERDTARAQAFAATQEVARLTKLTEHMATELNVAWESSRKHEAERDEARALNHRGLMKLVENERLRDALEEIAGMCSENAEQMQAIAQDALGSMPPSNLPYICPKSVAVAEDLTPGEITYVEVKPDMAELRMALREACGDAPLLEGALDELAAYRAYVPSLPDLVAAATKGATR